MAQIETEWVALINGINMNWQARRITGLGFRRHGFYVWLPHYLRDRQYRPHERFLVIGFSVTSGTLFQLDTF